MEYVIVCLWSLPLITYAPRGRGGGGQVSYIIISISYYMHNGGRGSRYHVKVHTYLMEGPYLVISMSEVCNCLKDMGESVMWEGYVVQVSSPCIGDCVEG